MVVMSLLVTCQCILGIIPVLLVASQVTLAGAVSLQLSIQLYSHMATSAFCCGIEISIKPAKLSTGVMI